MQDSFVCRAGQVSCQADARCLYIPRLPGAGGTVGGAADEPLPMDDMIEDAVLAAGGEMDDTPGDDEEFMPVGS